MKSIIIRSFSGIFLSLLTFLSFTSFRKTPNATLGESKSIYDFKLKTIDGKEITLSKFKGKKMLLVNVASECGYTPQYKNLQALHEQFGNKVVIIGFPANNFGGQEPGTAVEIKEFCTKTYSVAFQMMEKISVKGDDIHPLYKWLSTKSENGTCEDSPRWNFCKYLIDEKGNIIKFFSSKVDPLSAEITGLL